MKIIFNPDADFVAKMRESVIAKGGYCPCRLEKKEENYCMCQEFRNQIADSEFEGFCHCRLYYKEK
ncbi:MAG TPA: ferredoxin thioredoxin reductase catalytic beta chain [Spirochaetaceae bacterium]|nr:ferredoxin thioredoxin reductase catalytic beta chain [Spirochaetaceae bacterium]